DLAELTDNHLIVSVPNEFTKNWLDQRYTNFIDEIILELTGAEITVKFSIEQPSNELEDKKDPPALPEQLADDQLNMLNPKYTFDTFVVGAANRFAHAASLAVAEAPAKAYNPLFIYGGVGLGKTHLMHAIA